VHVCGREFEHLLILTDRRVNFSDEKKGQRADEVDARVEEDLSISVDDAKLGVILSMSLRNESARSSTEARLNGN